LVMQIALIGMPISMGVAILRYRLYEIDLIINRTLVYGSLTVTLVALYFVGIVVLQRVFVLLTGQQATLAVVASTLLIAALFTPLRGSIRSFIDRRFYRRKYDARKTLEAISSKVRNETDLKTLSDDLVGVVRERCSTVTTPREGSEGRADTLGIISFTQVSGSRGIVEVLIPLAAAGEAATSRLPRTLHCLHR